MKNIIIILFLLFNVGITAQAPDWINYTGGDEIMALAEEGDYIWVGTFGGLVKLNKKNNDAIFFNSCNSELPNNIIRAIYIDSDK
ncbi:hypothetical protein LJE82_17050, partial [bacterium BMS3Abin03]|nr:hypothetical protein [bacterium BMS3Abin03]